MNDVYLKHSTISTTRTIVWEKISQAIEQVKSLSGNAFFKKSEYLIEEARSKIAEFFGTKSREIKFTSGSVESNNIAVLGAPQAMEGKGNIFFVGSIEPGSILKPARHLKKLGYKCNEIPVNEYGIYDTDFLIDSLGIESTFVSVSRINRETGAKQDISAISRIAKQVSAVVHTDASHGLIEPLNVSKLGVDLMTVGGEFIGSLAGSGILFVREGTLIETLKIGKRHNVERKIEIDNLVNAIAMAEALQEISDTKNETRKKILRLRQVLEKELKKESVDLNFISDEECFPGIICATTSNFLDAESLVERMNMKGVSIYTAVETISDDEKTASHVLINMGKTDREILSAFTFSIGWNTTEDDIKIFAKILGEVINEK